MARETQRVQSMKDEFMDCHKQGLGIPEIAKRYHVTTRTIYNHLQAIADSNGVEREFLLERVHSPHVIVNVTRRQACSDFEEVQNLASELNSKISKLIEQIDSYINKEG